MWGRAFAGIVPGFFVSAALVGLACWSWPGPWQSTLVIGVAAFLPLWMGVIAASFQFRDARRAWTWLGVLALLGFALLLGLQHAGFVQ